MPRPNFDPEPDWDQVHDYVYDEDDFEYEDFLFREDEE